MFGRRHRIAKLVRQHLGIRSTDREAAPLAACEKLHFRYFRKR
jgi:hypothetical protein